MAWPDPFARPGCSNQPPGPAPKSRITIRVAPNRKRTAELPITDAMPTMMRPASTVAQNCRELLKTLSVHERDVVLCALLNEFGELSRR